jgi:isopentenyl-diphosphate delta-isomerase
LGIPGETGADLEAATKGVKRAAQRKLNQELGIPTEQVPPEGFEFLTRIHYKAPSAGLWGEHESMLSEPESVRQHTDRETVDYILFTQQTVDLNINPNEVKDYKYVTPEELKAMFKDESLTFTPWFKLICETMLFEWWANFDNLEKYKGETVIRRM